MNSHARKHRPAMAQPEQKLRDALALLRSQASHIDIERARTIVDSANTAIEVLTFQSNQSKDES